MLKFWLSDRSIFVLLWCIFTRQKVNNIHKAFVFMCSGGAIQKISSSFSSSGISSSFASLTVFPFLSLLHGELWSQFNLSFTFMQCYCDFFFFRELSPKLFSVFRAGKRFHIPSDLNWVVINTLSTVVSPFSWFNGRTRYVPPVPLGEFA